MPKVNVYIPQALADLLLGRTDVALSAVCQRALRAEVEKHVALPPASVVEAERQLLIAALYAVRADLLFPEGTVRSPDASSSLEAAARDLIRALDTEVYLS